MKISLLSIRVIYFYLLIHLAEQRARKISNSCNRKIDGSPCHRPDRSWQRDGVCRYKEGSYKECIAPGTKRFQLNIIAQYRSLSTLYSRVNTMYIRGTGPGLSWERALKMKRSARAVDIWSVQINYIVDSDGLPCLNSMHCTLNQKALEFRIYKDELGQQDMKGPNFYIPLPLSNSLFGSVSYRTPSVTVHPWFTSETVSVQPFQFELSYYLFSVGFTINCRLVYPPSFYENARKKYPLVILFDFSPHLNPGLEYLYVHEASVEEAVILMIEPPYINVLFMTPFKTHYELYCQGESEDCSSCQTCWVENRRDPCNSEEFIAKSRRCLTLKKREGHGTNFIDSIEKEVILRAQELSGNRLLFDPPRHRVSMIAHTDLAVLAFQAALTRPHLIQNVAVFSPRFHLPLTNKYEPLSLIFNYITQEKDILKNNPGQQYLHYSQKYYFDHGENDNFFFPLADTLRITEDVIGDLKEKLNLLDDVNIYNFLIPNERMVYMTKDFPDVLSRLKYPLTIFHGARGGANKDYVRAIKVSPAFIAQRQGSLLEASNVGGGGGSVITLLRPGNGSNNTNATTTMVTINVEGDGENDNCQSNNEECPERGVPLGIFIATIGVSTALSALIAVILMCLREGSRRAAEKEEKEEQELLEEFSSDDNIDL